MLIGCCASFQAAILEGDRAMPRVARLLLVVCFLMLSAPSPQRSLARPVAQAQQPAALASAAPVVQAAQPAALDSASPIGTWAIEPVGQNGGQARAVVVVGTYAYLLVTNPLDEHQSRILVLDISNPQAPVFVGQSQPRDTLAVALLVIKGYLYMFGTDIA